MLAASEGHAQLSGAGSMSSQATTFTLHVTCDSSRRYLLSLAGNVWGAGFEV